MCFLNLDYSSQFNLGGFSETRKKIIQQILGSATCGSWSFQRFLFSSSNCQISNWINNHEWKGISERTYWRYLWLAFLSFSIMEAFFFVSKRFHYLYGLQNICKPLEEDKKNRRTLLFKLAWTSLPWPCTRTAT